MQATQNGVQCVRYISPGVRKEYRQSDSGGIHVARLLWMSTFSCVDPFVDPPWVFVVTLDAFKDLLVCGRSG